ncbi:hypothetical protein G5B46_13865 [Caulobacter sp. 602-2]|uniref:Uncharacterized protein n=1 Tax=Caulobacter sp. 602-2 TaxID=2710887 RepID=A0A6G4QYJ6_9CAUL|nr:hypothetical protein [Caulobacter sp. 602-2]NGM50700.1 hypothetical protein [Caulobacter sp. 602-2]
MRQLKAIAPVIALAAALTLAPQRPAAQSLPPTSPQPSACDPDRQRYADSIGVPCSALRALEPSSASPSKTPAQPARPAPVAAQPDRAAVAPASVQAPTRRADSGSSQASAPVQAARTSTPSRLALSISLPFRSGVTLDIRRLDAPGKTVISRSQSLYSSPPDFSGEISERLTGPAADMGYSYVSAMDFKAKVIVKDLPAGRYEIRSIQTSTGAGGTIYLKRDFEELGLTFDIAPGTTTYLGEFGLWSINSKSRIGLQTTAGAIVVVRDQSARDLPLAARSRDLGEVKISVPDVERLRQPLIQPRL